MNSDSVKKQKSPDQESEGVGVRGCTNHCPIIFLFMLNTYCTSVAFISCFTATWIGRENSAVPKSVDVIFNASYTISRSK